MTTDPFTDAARAEALRAWVKEPDRMDSIGTLGAHMAEWARDRLAEQEATDAEVEAAARALAYWDGADRWATPEYDGEIPESAYRHGARKALSAARAARRDEEKRDG